MNAVQVLLLIVACAGLSLVLTDLRWFRQRGLSGRLRPYGPPGRPTPGATDPSPKALLTALGGQVIERITRMLGVRDHLAVRLARTDLGITPSDFRSRQMLHFVVGLAGGGLAALWLQPPPVVAILLVAGVPLLAVLADEQRLSGRIARRKDRLQLELPVVAEQLGIFVDSGASLPSAIARVGQRGRGVAAADLRRVAQRIRRGTSESTALREWADRVDLDAVRRLASVLSMHREATDLGRLISEEARSIRAESHRDLVERIERRGQLVWIPVTVATLVPGLLFLAVPFFSALTQVAGS